MIVHDRYQNTTPSKLGELIHQLCCQHLLGDLADAGEVYPDALWTPQIARALRGLIHQASIADVPARTSSTARRSPDRLVPAPARGSGCRNTTHRPTGLG